MPTSGKISISSSRINDIQSSSTNPVQVNSTFIYRSSIYFAYLNNSEAYNTTANGNALNHDVFYNSSGTVNIAEYDTFYNSTTNIVNVSYSVISDLYMYGMVKNSQVEPTRAISVDSMYDDWIDFNYTIPELMTLKVIPLEIATITNSASWLNVTYSLIDFASMLHFGAGYNATFSHDKFSDFILVNALDSISAQLFYNQIEVLWNE